MKDIHAAGSYLSPGEFESMFDDDNNYHIDSNVEGLNVVSFETRLGGMYLTLANRLGGVFAVLEEIEVNRVTLIKVTQFFEYSE